jgi:hypothetical protein
MQQKFERMMLYFMWLMREKRRLRRRNWWGTSSGSILVCQHHLIFKFELGEERRNKSLVAHRQIPGRMHSVPLLSAHFYGVEPLEKFSRVYSGAYLVKCNINR